MRRTPRTSSPGSATAGSRPTCRRTSRNSGPASIAIADGLFASSRIYVVSLAYNTNMVKPEDAPKSFMDLLHPKWMNRLVKAHPSYSGTIMTSTYQIARDLGWDYFEKLAKQKVMQVQSSVDPPNKVALGERAAMADGNDFNVILHKEAGRPVEIVYPAEGAPLIVCPNAVLKAAPNPNAARLFQSYLFSQEGQQALCDFAAQHSAHPQVKPKPGRPAAQGHQGDEGRSGRGRSAGGRDQGALSEDLRRVM